MLVTPRAWRRALAASVIALVIVAAEAGPAGPPEAAAGATLRFLAGWTTSFTPSDHNGWGANIWIPARTLDGYVVAPGERFDFWTAVGPITRARGYRIGGAIVGGHTREGVALGGGICAASSTLFNAAYRAGFPINARSPHYYYITRYPVGLDATVSSSQGMAWTNDTRYPVLIKGLTGASSVRFELWSGPSGRSVAISNPVITGYRNARTLYVHTSALPDGARRLIEYTIDGFSAAVTRTVRNSAGAIVRRETTRSTYHRVDGTILIGDHRAPYVPVPAHAPS
jgi:vancomycin resistance protein YoaR